MDVNRNCPNTPSISDLKPPIFTPRDRSPFQVGQGASGESHRSLYALDISQFPDVQTPLNSFSLTEQLRLERDIAQQSSVITRDSFNTTYSGLQTMLSQMQLKVAAAFLQETEYLQQREQRLESAEQQLVDRTKYLAHLRHDRERLEDNFAQVKDRLECAVIQVTKFQTDGAETLRNLFSESRQIDEQLSQLISDSMASLARSRVLVHSKTTDFLQKSDRIRSEFVDRTRLIRQTESTIGMMLDLINVLHQVNTEHSQDLSIATTDFHRKNDEFVQRADSLQHHWDIEKEIEQIRTLENEKIAVERDLFEHTLLLENLKTVLGKAVVQP